MGRKWALCTPGILGFTDQPSVPDEPVMRSRPHVLRNNLHQLQLGFIRGIGSGQSDPVGNPENVSVNCNSILIEAHTQYHIGCFSAHTGQFFQFLTGLRNLTVILLLEDFTGRQDISGFTAK